MNKFVCLSLALFATVAMAQPYHHAAPSHYKGESHKVHEISLEGLSKLTDIAAIEKYLNAPAHGYHAEHKASYAPAKYVAAAAAPVAGPVYSKSYSAAPSAHHGYEKHSDALAHYHYEAPAAYEAPAYKAPAHKAPAYKAPAVYEAPETYSAAAEYKAPAEYKTHEAYSPKKSGYEAHSALKYAALPAYVTQIYAGKHNYKTYQTPIKYSTVTLPVAPSGPVANLYVPEHKGHGYGSSHSTYSGPSY